MKKSILSFAILYCTIYGAYTQTIGPGDPSNHLLIPLGVNGISATTTDSIMFFKNVKFNNNVDFKGYLNTLGNINTTGNISANKKIILSDEHSYVNLEFKYGFATFDGDKEFCFAKPVYMEKLSSSINSLELQTNSTTRILINNSGNVGIGTMYPGQRLHVAGGNSYFEGNMGIGANPSSTHKLQVTGSTYFNGNVGIGVSSPSYKLHVADNTYFVGNMGIGTTPTSSYKLQVTGNSYFNGNIGIGTAPSTTNKLQVTGNSYFNGNIGIGVSNPTKKLQVSGDSYFTGKVGIGTGAETPYNNFQIGSIWTFYDGSSDKIIGRNTYYNGSSNVRITQGVASRMYFGGSGDIFFQTAASEAANSVISTWNTVVLKNDGSFGIGTTSPSQKLHVVGVSYFNGNVGIGTASPSQNLHVAGNTCVTGNVGIGITSPTQKLHVVGNSYFNGNVGIGTSNTFNYKLAVNGIIGAKEVKVEATSNWPDYVFGKDYKLLELSEIEQFVKENQHLPEIPSAKEIEENGINVGEMQGKLLLKIEELTLYVIEQQKSIEKLNTKIDNLEKELENR